MTSPLQMHGNSQMGFGYLFVKGGALKLTRGLAQENKKEKTTAGHVPSKNFPILSFPNFLTPQAKKARSKAPQVKGLGDLNHLWFV